MTVHFSPGTLRSLPVSQCRDHDDYISLPIQRASNIFKKHKNKIYLPHAVQSTYYYVSVANLESR